MTTVGKPVPRIDGRLKVTGAAVYAADTAVARCAHAGIATSKIARGTATVDARGAARAPGGLAVVTAANAPRLPSTGGHGPGDRVLQLLQDDLIAYADQPIAVVVADTIEHARAAAAELVVRYREEPPQGALIQALGEAYVPKTRPPTGPVDSRRGDVDAGLRQAAHRVAQTYTTAIQTHHPMEPHATVAVWTGTDRLTVYDASQHVYGVRATLARVFGLVPDRIRVIDRYVGGAFGCKGTPWSHVALAALAAKLVGRPVKLMITRPQMFALVGHRPTTVQELELGCDAGGRLVAMRHGVVNETSRFDEFIEASAIATRMLYRCANVETSHRLVRLDIPTPTFTRAPGEATGQFALESAVDELADAAGIDPLELRVVNHADRDDNERLPFSSKSLRDCYARGAEAIGWARRPHATRATRRGDKLVGIGMATASYPARMLPANARVRVADGKAVVQIATADLGTGTYTILAQLAADTLGLPLDRVAVELGDTALPEAPVSAGLDDRRERGVGRPRRVPAGARQARRRRARGRRRCAQRPVRRSRRLLVPRVRRRVRGGRGRRGHRRGEGVAARRRLRVRQDPQPAHRAQPADRRAGVGDRDGARRDHAARPPQRARDVTRDLADYHVPVSADVPYIDVILVDERDPFVNALGVKGLGEIGTCGATAAIANAIWHATGRRVRDLPITLDKLMRTV